MNANAHARRGVVLATALYYLAIHALLVVGTLYASRGARDGAARAATDATLTGALDRTLAAAKSTWSPAARAKQLVGEQSPLPALADLRDVSGATTITRLGPTLYLLATDVSWRASEEAHRHATLLMRSIVARPMLATPIVSRGDVNIGSGAHVVIDSAAAADCPPPARAALSIAPDAALYLDGPRSDTVVALSDPAALDAAAFENFGGESWSTLANRADIRLAAGATLRPFMATHDSCVMARAVDDWGDRTAADGCVVAPPIVVAAGDLTIDGGAGVGVLLVAGRLRITGPFVYAGVIVARDGVEITGDDVEISGSVLAERLTTTESSASGASLLMRGRSSIRASSCVTFRVFASRAGVRSVHSRAWLERF